MKNVISFDFEKKKIIEAFIVVVGRQEGRTEGAFSVTTYLMFYFQNILFCSTFNLVGTLEL